MAKETRILIIHGWSDCSESFKGMKDLLVKRQIGQVETIFYADYESREDDMTFEDIVEGLNDQLISEKLIYNNGKSDYDLKIIVHSTGGLVVRHWIWRYYAALNRMDVCPVTNLVMLAPANFGSPLAQMGKSFLGGLVKGRWKVGDFLEVGKKILDGLELGSEYQWRLAHSDLLQKENYFVPQKIRTTVLVGDTDYNGFRGWINKPGTDGTVVISGTNLNSIKLCLKFGIPQGLEDIYLPHQWDTTSSVSDTAFALLHGYNHGTIVDDSGKESTDPAAICNVLARALEVSEADFPAMQKDFAALTEAAYAASPGLSRYQQFLVHAADYHDQPARDFTLDFAVYSKSSVHAPIHCETAQTQNEEANDQTETEYDYSVKVNDLINAQTHAFSNDSSYRRFLVDCTALYDLVNKMDAEPEFSGGYGIFMKVFVPAVDDKIGYYTKNLQNILIYDSAGPAEGVPKFFFENTTTLLEIQVDRMNSYVTVGTEPLEH